MNKIHYLALIILSFFIVSCGQNDNNTNTEVASPVSIDNIKLSNIEQLISSTGTAIAKSEATLTTEIEGIYKLRNNPKTGKPFALGDKVSKGQAIIDLESTEYINGIGIEAKKLNLDIAKQTYEKQKSLYDKGGVTQSELSNAQVALVNAKDTYELAQIQLEKTKVKAPFEGVITSLPVYTSGVTIANGVEVARLMNYSKLLLVVNLPEKHINDIEVGQDIRIINYTLPEDTLSGVLTQVSPAISTETRTFESQIEIDNPNLLLRPGMFVQADIILDRRENVIVIPKDIVLSTRRGKTVFVVNNSTAEEKRVTFGYENGNNVEITSGLNENDRLVVKGFETLRNRSKVKIVK